ncbi:MAG: homoserine kinase, partial [Endozoicomonas sp.]
TNYFLDVVKEGIRTRYVLTLFEYLPAETLPFFIAYTDELKADGLPVPNPVRDIRGRALHTLKNKPALIVQCFRGKHPDPTALTKDHCTQVGTILARIHTVSEKSRLHQKNQRGLPWLDEQQKRLQPLLSQEDAKYMKAQWLDISQSLRPFTRLPEGLIHGDLFHDNVLLDQGKISAVIDFYQACHDWLIYDLAVTVNDWCLTDSLQLDPGRFNALVNAYSQVRPFTEEEKAAWPLILRLAAFRFWISRIITFVHPEKPTDDEHQESLVRAFLDPDEFRDMLKLRTESAVPPLP